MKVCVLCVLAGLIAVSFGCSDTPHKNAAGGDGGNGEGQHVAGASGEGGASGAAGEGGASGAAGEGGASGESGASGEGGAGGESGASGEGGAGGGMPENCGNSMLDEGEQCDDGNLTALDGCGPSCRFDRGWVCPEPGEPCETVCGDGQVAGDEVCDDGNEDDDDYCFDECSTEGSCGDGIHQPGANEQCDDGNTETEACEYGEESCTVCAENCTNFSGAATYCGDSTVTESEGETCDDGNAVTEDCEYGAASCTVCDEDCAEAAGATHACGDEVTDAPDEQCDDGNDVTESCTYGLASCTVCNSTCQNAPGATSFCGDAVVDTDNGEDCDDGNDVTEACAYGQTTCSVCGSTCTTTSGVTSYCGDQRIDGDNGETCDDGDEDPLDGCDDCTVAAIPDCGDSVIDEAIGEDCDDGNDESLDGCNAACQQETGWTCPGPGEDCVAICGDGLVVGDEPCDDDNDVDDDYCSNDCSTRRFCGDGAVQASASEQCDDSNSVTETCTYGQTNCTVCNASCQEVPGATSYCGDTVLDADNGEECDEGAATETCRSDCKLQRYCIVEASLTGTYQITSTLAGLGDGSYPQTGGTVRMRLPDNGSGAPGAHAASLNRAGILYYNMPVSFVTSIPLLSMTVTTMVTTSAGSPTNTCPLNRGTLAGTNVTWASCPYRPNSGGTGHCTTDWNPDHQNPPEITPGPGCLPVSAAGNIHCDGTDGACDLGALDPGDNEVDDAWSQPQNTVQFNPGFTTSVMNGLGGPTDCGATDPSRTSSASYTNKLETPERVNSRGWITTSGTNVSTTCNLLPADCD